MNAGRAALANPRAAAALVLEQVMAAARRLDDALDDALAARPSEPALIQELAYGTLRWFHLLQAIAGMFLVKPLKPKDRDLQALLLIGLYQLRFMRVATHAAVHETVAAAEALEKPWAKGLINACLREYLRRETQARAEIEKDPALALSHPPWLLEKIRSAYPDRWREILAAGNERPPMTLRVNLAKTTRAAYRGRLHAAGLAAREQFVLASDLTLEQPAPVAQLPGFAQGEVSVQDAAAQFAAVLLDAQPGERLLDACAAPGGKTGHVLERAAGRLELVALDREPARVALIAQNLGRLGLAARLVAADAMRPEPWWDGRPFDRILLDAPCSATGVLRRHPDVKLRRRPTDLPRLGQTQAGLLSALWPLLKPGGKLLYVTCSILPEENEQPIQAFLAHAADAVEEPLPPDVGPARAAGRQILPGQSGMDGFYYARLRKG